MTDRRDDSLVPFTSLLDEGFFTTLHALFDHPAPAESMVRQFSVPFVIGERDLALLQILLGRLRFEPRFGAVDLVGLAFDIWVVPGVEKLTRVAALRHPLRAILAELFTR